MSHPLGTKGGMTDLDAASAPDWSVWSPAARAVMARASAAAGTAPVGVVHVVAALDAEPVGSSDHLPTIAAMDPVLTAGVRAAVALRIVHGDDAVRLGHLLAGVVDAAPVDPTVVAQLLRHLSVTDDPVDAGALSAVAATFDAPLTEMLRHGEPPTAQAGPPGLAPTASPVPSTHHPQETAMTDPAVDLASRIDALLPTEQAIAGSKAVDHLRTYYESYTGRWFDRIGRRDDGLDEHPMALTAADTVAVSFLSVDIRPEATARILFERADEISELLREIPTHLSIAEPDARNHLADDGPAAALWQLLDDLPGIGWVVAHKLLAHKRPALLPVYDSVTKQVLQPDDPTFWLPLHDALGGEGGARRMATLRAVRDAAGPPRPITELRVLDVLAWMEGKGA